MDITKKIEKEIIKRCNNAKNEFGSGIWPYHIKCVVKNAVFLAEKYQADIEVVTLATLLHDIASVTDKKYYEEHNVNGAEMADELLTKLNELRNY